MPRTPLISDIVTRVSLPSQVAGPYAEETEDSRIGLESGLTGSSNVTRKWRVYCTNKTDNPLQVIQDIPTSNGGVTLAEPFPTTEGWGDGSYLLSNLAILDHWPGTAVWIVQGRYVPSYVASLPTERWAFRIRSSIESERVYTDLDGKGVGTPKYVDASAPPPGTTTPREVYFARNPDGVVRNLQLLDGSANPFAKELPRYMTGVDVPSRTSVLTLSKRVPTWVSDGIRYVQNQLGKVNDSPFSTLTSSGEIVWVDEDATGLLLFSDIDIEPIANVEGGEVPSFQVTLTFRFNPYGWQHKVLHTFKFDDGSESLIYRSVPTPDGASIQYLEETFRVIDSANLMEVINNFGN